MNEPLNEGPLSWPVGDMLGATKDCLVMLLLPLVELFVLMLSGMAGGAKANSVGDDSDEEWSTMMLDGGDVQVVAAELEKVSSSGARGMEGWVTAGESGLNRIMQEH
jgi:hypothetical protein